MPDTTDATARAVKPREGRSLLLSEREITLLRECCAFCISTDSRTYYRLGGYGCVPLRYNVQTLPRLKAYGLVTDAKGYWTATEKGRAHPAAQPRPDAATA